MCGIFGFHGNSRPAGALLSAAAAAAGRRGPHGCGWATRSDMLPLQVEHHPGALASHLPAITALRSTSVLGHARLATVGDWRQVDQLQPISVSGYALAHNGVIANPDDLAPGHPTDSIALAHAYATLRYDGVHPLTVLDKLIAAARQQAWAIVVLDTNGRLYAHRRYHPLYRFQTTEGTYLSSQRFHPVAELVEEDTAVIV